MRNRKVTWLSIVGGIVLITGGVLANWGAGVPSVGAQAGGNPFSQILQKLDQILGAIGDIKEGNHTLRWDTNNPSASRFVTLATFNNQAVMDKNTGLVWEQAPDTTSKPWVAAKSDCVNKNVGGTRGWRMPSVAELASLIDPTLSAPFVPSNVFAGVQPGFSNAVYWTASTAAGIMLGGIPTTAIAWDVNFSQAIVGAADKEGSLRVWCVRGSTQEHEY